MKTSSMQLRFQTHVSCVHWHYQWWYRTKCNWNLWIRFKDWLSLPSTAKRSKIPTIDTCSMCLHTFAAPSISKTFGLHFEKKLNLQNNWWHSTLMLIECQLLHLVVARLIIIVIYPLYVTTYYHSCVWCIGLVYSTLIYVSLFESCVGGLGESRHKSHSGNSRDCHHT